MSSAFAPGATGTTIPDRFRDLVTAAPEARAITSATSEWTYAELADQAERIAAGVLGRSTTDRPVLLLLETDAPLIASMLGTLRAGAFYVPLDPELPADQAWHRVRLAEPCLVVTRSGLRSQAEAVAPGLPIVEIDSLAPPQATTWPSVSPSDPAYLLLTSGSTGDVKGVVQSHRNVLANVARLKQACRLTAGDRISLLGSASHGAAASDLFGALLTGAELLPLRPRTTSPSALRLWAVSRGLTVWHSVPGLFRRFARAVDAPTELPQLRLVKLGGEAVFASDLELFQRRFAPGVTFHVGLGMTEMNTICHWSADHSTTVTASVLPVGSPALGIDLLLFGEQGEEIGSGPGELGIVSDFLPDGYWRRPDLTERSFQRLSDGRQVFRSGDIVERSHEGVFLHRGRRDRQLKVRGLRVDGWEVEAALRRCPAVRDAAVDVRPNASGDPELTAWLVAAESPLDFQDLRRQLAEKVPAEAVPSRLITVTDLPTTESGKIDLAALPDPGPVPIDTASTSGADHEAPLVEQIGAALASVLNLPALGPDDDFFASGGTSLTALDAALAIEKILREPVDLAVFLDTATPRSLATRLNGRRTLLTALTAGSDGPPIFFAPAHGAGEGPDLLQLARLARKIRFGGAAFALRMPWPPPADVEGLLVAWSDAIRLRQPVGPWHIVAACAGGPIGFGLASRLAGLGTVRLALHDALFPTPQRKIVVRLRRWREPWGDDLVARVLHHLRELPRRGLRKAGSYLRNLGRSVARGVERRESSTGQRLLGARDAYLQMSLRCPLEPWDGETLLVLTPTRQGRGLAEHWRSVAPRLTVRETGSDAENESATLLRVYFTAAPDPQEARLSSTAV
jgi:amino acid adenylation domain-containing protein